MTYFGTCRQDNHGSKSFFNTDEHSRNIYYTVIYCQKLFGDEQTLYFVRSSFGVKKFDIKVKKRWVEVRQHVCTSRWGWNSQFIPWIYLNVTTNAYAQVLKPHGYKACLVGFTNSWKLSNIAYGIWIHLWKQFGGAWAHNRCVQALGKFKIALLCT